MSGAQGQVLQPNVSITLANADREVSNFDQKVLLVGQKVAGGTATDGVLIQNLSSSGAPEDLLFGKESMLAGMVRAFRRINKVVQLDVIPLDDGVGTPREVTITYVGSSTEAGVITVTAGSEANHRFPIAVALGDTPTVIAAAVAAAIEADTACPFSAASVAGVVTLTAANDGTVMNNLGVESIGSVAGVTGQAVAETVPGATDPTLTGILDVATDRYQGVVWPYTVITVLKTYLDARFNVDNEILDGVGFVGLMDSHSNWLTTLGGHNSESIVYFADKTESETNYKGPSMNEPPYEKATQFAAVRALRLTPDAALARYLTSASSRDQFGGAALASLPYFNTTLPDLSLVKSPRGWTQVETEQLIDAGGSVLGVNRTNTNVLVGEVVTTFKTDPAGNPDITFGFLNHVDVSSNVREYFFNNLRQRFAQSRLTDGAVRRGRDMANSATIRAYCEQLYQDLASSDFVLVQGGPVPVRFFKTNLDIVLDLSLGKATITMFVPIVVQLRDIIATVKIAFDAGGEA